MVCPERSGNGLHMRAGSSMLLTGSAHLSVHQAVVEAGVLRQLRCPRRTPIGAALHHDRVVWSRLREPVLLLPLLLG